MKIGRLKLLANTDGLVGADTLQDDLVRLAVDKAYADLRDRFGYRWWQKKDTTLTFPSGESTLRLPSDFLSVDGEVRYATNSTGASTIYGWAPKGMILPYIGDDNPHQQINSQSDDPALAGIYGFLGYYLRYGYNPITSDPADVQPDPNPQGGEQQTGTLMVLATTPDTILRVFFTYIRTVSFDQNFDETELNNYMPGVMQQAILDCLRYSYADARPMDLKPQISARLETKYDKALSAVNAYNRPAQGPGKISYSH